MFGRVAFGYLLEAFGAPCVWRLVCAGKCLADRPDATFGPITAV
jgi:hypothetical protein